ncbi:MAG: hypothetical protein J5623_06255 [Clostridiales bacterium]|nr:hypothetical protein [Clostridiales bacterium]
MFEASTMELIRKLERYRELLAETIELRSRIRPQSEFPVSMHSDFKKRSLMKYFWPYLVGGIGGGSVVYAITAFIAFYSMMNTAKYTLSRDQASSAATRMMGDVYVGYFAAVIIALAIIFIGLKIAKAKQAAFNKNCDYMNAEVAERYQQGQLNARMQSVLDDDLREMRMYESMVPEDFRTPERVTEILALIKQEKATTVDEACVLLA